MTDMSKQPNKKKKGRKKPKTEENKLWTSAMTVISLCAVLGAFGGIWLVGNLYDWKPRLPHSMHEQPGFHWVVVCAVIAGLIGGRLSKKK